MIDEAHESLTRIMRVSVEQSHQMVLQPDLKKNQRFVLSRVERRRGDTLRLCAERPTRRSVTINPKRGDYIYRIDDHWMFVSDALEGRVSRLITPIDLE